jgi:hypothetical protein
MNMNSCQHVDKIIDYHLGYLSEDQKVAFEAHLKSCKMCQRELQVELAIEEELSEKLQPGFVEARIKARLQLRRTMDVRAFLLYVYRTAVYAVTAAMVGLVLVPFLLKLPLSTPLDLSRYTNGLAGLLNKLLPANNLFIVIGLCYMLFVVTSVFSLARIRR